MIRIVLADDHAVIRSGLRSLLQQQEGFQVVGEAGDGRVAVEVVEKTRPNVIVMDLTMPGLNGIEAARQITSRNLGAAIVVLTMHSDEGYVLRALKAGVRGYLLKESLDSDLMQAIHSVHQGKAFFSPAVSRVLVEDYMRQLQDREIEDSFDLLTPREKEILQMVAEGRSNKEVANVLNLSVYTVETHRSNVMEKLNLHSVPELILYAVRKGVIT